MIRIDSHFWTQFCPTTLLEKLNGLAPDLVLIEHGSYQAFVKPVITGMKRYKDEHSRDKCSISGTLVPK